MMGFGLRRRYISAKSFMEEEVKHKGAKDKLKYIKTLAKAMREDNTLRESTIKHLKSLNEGNYRHKRQETYDFKMSIYMDKVKSCTS